MSQAAKPVSVSHRSVYQAPTRIAQAVQYLEMGGVIGYPTEGVWGLGCDPFNQQAVERILQLKQRPLEKGLILVASAVEQIAALLPARGRHALDPAIRQQILDSWPGPNTWLLPDPDALVPGWIKGQHSAVAVRVSAHPVVQALCQAFDGPIVSTSANPAGLRAATEAYQVRRYFGAELSLIAPGRVFAGAKPSTIRDALSGRILR